MDGKLCDDVREQEMAMILSGRVNATLGEKTRPRKRHEATQLVALLPTMIETASNCFLKIYMKNNAVSCLILKNTHTQL